MKMNDCDLVRIIIVDISKAFGSNVFDEAILPIDKATDFIEKYIDISKYRIITI